MAVTLTITEVSKRAGMSRRTIGRMIADGRLEAVQDPAGVWRITPAQAIAAGIPLDRSTPTETAVETATDETERLRAELVELHIRTKVAEALTEALVAERDRVLSDLQEARSDLRQLFVAHRELIAAQDRSLARAQHLHAHSLTTSTDGPPSTVTATTGTDEPMSSVMSTAPAGSQPRRRWWHRQV